MNGPRTIPTHIAIATSHPTLAKILHDTPWQSQWSRSLARLARLPGAESPQKNWRYGTGVQSKAVLVPLANIDRGDDP